MKSKDLKMPAFGVGPFYVVSCLLLTIVGLYLHFSGFLSAVEFKREKNLYYNRSNFNTLWFILMDTSSYN